VGRFQVEIRGRAAHAGLDPTGGSSAILELSHVVQALHGLTDLERGITVNVGVIEGGTRANVIAAESRAQVDVRALTREDAAEVTEKIRSLRPAVDGVELVVTGGFQVPPLERTPRNRVLWRQARELGAGLGLELVETTAGGGSDGNTTSQYTATLDGLGPRGDGAHAEREHIVVESLVERTALLAALLAAPVEGPEGSDRMPG
jgi:glutamate carboxypeptidase